MKGIKNQFIVLLFVIFFVCACLTMTGCSAFKVPRFTVNFRIEKNGEIIKTQTVRSSLYINYPVPECEPGYAFKGYKNEKDDEVVYYAEKTQEEQPEVNYDDINYFYAYFEPITYSVTYDFNGGTGTEGQKEYTVNDEFSISNPQKQGFVFIGWTSELNTYPQVDYSIEKGTIGNLNFVANWGESDTYYLNFKTCGGSDIEGQISKTGLFSTAPLDPQKAGYEFSHWVTESGETVTFPLSATSTVTTIKAEWSVISYVITCPSVSDFKTITYTAEDEVSVPDVEKVGYTFNGYTYVGQTIPKKSLTFKKGTYGDIELTPHFTINTYTITFETNGGSEIAIAKYDFNAMTTAPDTPTKNYCEFIGWYDDEDFTVLHEFSNMPAKDITVYAKWYSEREHTLSYSVKNSSANIDCNVQSGKKAIYADRIFLSVPSIEGGVFKYWLKNGEVYSYNPSIAFNMPDEDVELIAEYQSATQLSFDKSSPKNLSLPFTNVGFIAGNELLETDYVVGVESLSAYIKSDYLSSLKDGVYPFYYSSSEEAVGEYFIVAVTSKSSVKNLQVDYDTNYPEVTITFDCDAKKTYEYSLDNSAYKSIENGLKLTKYAYDKSKAHTITIRATDDETDSASVTKKAYTFLTKDYYESSFTYGGVKHDYVAESFDELKIICEYVAYVLAPNDSSLSTNLKFAYSGDWISNKAIPEAMTSIGIPYSPSYTYTNATSSISTMSLTIKKRNSTPNKNKSTQEKVEVNDSQKLLTDSSRTSNSTLKIDEFSLTQEIRSVYELENLPYGVKPVSFSSTEAEEVYNAARTALTQIVDDDMNDFEKVTAIYDYLALNVTYDEVVAEMATTSDTTMYRAFTTYGALVDNVAVCDGIAGAVRLMCIMEGIPATEVSGTGNGGGHAWNKVEIYGQIYALDATWSRTQINNKYYVTSTYLLIDEARLYETKHIESASSSSAKRFSENIAFNANDYFSLNLNGAKHFVSTQSDFNALIKSAKSQGATAVELKLASGCDINTFVLKSSYFSLLNRPQIYTLSNGTTMLLW